MRDARVRVVHVELRDRRARHAARVCNGECNGQLEGGIVGGGSRYGKVRESEGRVRKAKAAISMSGLVSKIVQMRVNVPKGKERLDVPCEVMFVSDEYVLPVMDLAPLANRAAKRRRILDTNGQSERQAAGRVGLAVYHVRQSVAH